MSNDELSDSDFIADDGIAEDSVSLDEVIALNDELVALMESGVPLEVGLQQFGRQHKGVAAHIATRLSARMSRGESLLSALQAEQSGLPRAYCVMVEAGLRSGRLTVALEAMTEFARNLRELRRRLGLALLYPLIVCLLAYGLFVGILLPFSVHRLLPIFQDFGVEPHPILGFLGDATAHLSSWIWIPPALAVLLVVWWTQTSRAQLLEFRGLSRPLGWLPGMQRIGRDFRFSNMAELMALMVQHQIPLPDALVLAADATSTKPVRRIARKLAETLRTGQAIKPNAAVATMLQQRQFPPFLKWLLSHDKTGDQLATAMHQASQMYRNRAEYRVEWLRVVFPSVASVVIGGTVTLAYVLILMLPFTTLIKSLATAGE